MTNIWRINLENCTATHEDGWVFQFRRVDDDDLGGGWEGICISTPTSADFNQIARLASEAGDAYLEALQHRH